MRRIATFTGGLITMSIAGPFLNQLFLIALEFSKTAYSDSELTNLATYVVIIGWIAGYLGAFFIGSKAVDWCIKHDEKEGD